MLGAAASVPWADVLNRAGPMTIDRVDLAPLTAHLAARGADSLAHPGGTLLAHLRRVATRLEGWGADPSLIAAGLCHAAYGTQGFPQPLLGLDERAALVSWIGNEAEAIVYAYCACDRAHGLAGTASRPDMLNRFTGERFIPSTRLQRQLMELTVANELDVLERASLSLGEREAILTLFLECHAGITPAAASAVDAVLQR